MYLCSSRTVDTVEAAAVDLAMLRWVVRDNQLSWHSVMGIKFFLWADFYCVLQGLIAQQIIPKGLNSLSKSKFLILS